MLYSEENTREAGIILVGKFHSSWCYEKNRGYMLIFSWMLVMRIVRILAGLGYMARPTISIGDAVLKLNL
jgi:hypothetical protein